MQGGGHGRRRPTVTYCTLGGLIDWPRLRFATKEQFVNWGCRTSHLFVGKCLCHKSTDCRQMSRHDIRHVYQVQVTNTGKCLDMESYHVYTRDRPGGRLPRLPACGVYRLHRTKKRSANRRPPRRHPSTMERPRGCACDILHKSNHIALQTRVSRTVATTPATPRSRVVRA